MVEGEEAVEGVELMCGISLGERVGEELLGMGMSMVRKCLVDELCYVLLKVLIILPLL